MSSVFKCCLMDHTDQNIKKNSIEIGFSERIEAGNNAGCIKVSSYNIFVVVVVVWSLDRGSSGKFVICHISHGICEISVGCVVAGLVAPFNSCCVKGSKAPQAAVTSRRYPISLSFSPTLSPSLSLSAFTTFICISSI